MCIRDRATLDIQFFERFYHKFDIGQQGAILFGTNEGTVLYRRPLLTDSMGSPWRNRPCSGNTSALQTPARSRYVPVRTM